MSGELRKPALVLGVLSLAAAFGGACDTAVTLPFGSGVTPTVTGSPTPLPSPTGTTHSVATPMPTPLTVPPATSTLLNACTRVNNTSGNDIAVVNPAAFAAGVEILLLQVQDSTGLEGTYDLLLVAANPSGDVVHLSRPPAISFGTDSTRAAEACVVPYFSTLTVNGTVGAPPWDGISGGVVAIRADRILLSSPGMIDVSARGFRGGIANGRDDIIADSSTPNCVPAANADGANKGEGALPPDPAAAACRAARSSGGGGGNKTRAAGGGGGNGGAGGSGGSLAGATSFGIGGGATNIATRLFFGGGGGGGNPNLTAGSGGSGGGIVLVLTSSITGGAVLANGGSGTSSNFDAGGGGGGAGGTIRVEAFTIGTTSFGATGGDGGDVVNMTVEPDGPGGGGGGGHFVTGRASHAATLTGGVPGKTNGDSLNAQPGGAIGTQGATPIPSPS